MYNVVMEAGGFILIIEETCINYAEQRFFHQ